MRWYKKYSRIVKRFALFPIEIGDETRWLETVYIVQRYNSYNSFFTWVNRDFVTKEDYLYYRKELNNAD